MIPGTPAIPGTYNEKDDCPIATDRGKSLDCGHPTVCHGKVNEDDPNEVVHCLWCGDIKDLETVCHNLALVYDHVTGGRVSKPLTDPQAVMALADDCTDKAVDEFVKDAVEIATREIKDQIHALADQIWQGLLDKRQASDALYEIAGVKTSAEEGAQSGRSSEGAQARRSEEGCPTSALSTSTTPLNAAPPERRTN